jgi:phosphatidylglycerophosphate synthase
MLDAPLRRVVAPVLAMGAKRLAHAGVRPAAVTGAGWLAGALACVAAATHMWPLALGLWLVNRLLDGLDGAVAAVTGATDLGGFLDIVADFSIYGGFIVAVAVAEPDARLACVALLTSYYLSGTAFLALSSLLERRGGIATDRRSLRFVGGLAEGAETIVVYVLFCLYPTHAALIAWAFSAAVAITVVQRIALAVALLRQPHPSTPARVPVPQ